MADAFALYTYTDPGRSDVVFTDFQVGRLKLALHLGIHSHLGALSVSSVYAKQLLLQIPSDFVSGRVPLYVCGCCADLGCGAVTVQVEETDEGIIWRDIGYEGLDAEHHSQSPYMERTGPFLFVPSVYRTALLPYTAGLLK
jgi:hypothetical protein